MTERTGRDTRVILIRHGHSVAQDENRMPAAHDRCPGLSPLGRRQAAALAKRALQTQEFADVDIVYTSPSTRAQETADLLREVLPGPYIAECDWCESHPGDAEGVAWEEFEDRFPKRGSLADPFERRIPGGESWAEFFARSGERLRRLVHDDKGKQILVVTHGGMIGASFVALGDVPIGKAYDYTAGTENTSLTEWVHRGGGWQLVRYNDFAHLPLLMHPRGHADAV